MNSWPFKGLPDQFAFGGRPAMDVYFTQVEVDEEHTANDGSMEPMPGHYERVLIKHILQSRQNISIAWVDLQFRETTNHTTPGSSGGPSSVFKSALAASAAARNRKPRCELTEPNWIDDPCWFCFQPDSGSITLGNRQGIFVTSLADANAAASTTPITKPHRPTAWHCQTGLSLHGPWRDNNCFRANGGCCTPAPPLRTETWPHSHRGGAGANASRGRGGPGPSPRVNSWVN